MLFHRSEIGIRNAEFGMRNYPRKPFLLRRRLVLARLVSIRASPTQPGGKRELPFTLRCSPVSPLGRRLLFAVSLWASVNSGEQSLTDAWRFAGLTVGLKPDSSKYWQFLSTCLPSSQAGAWMRELLCLSSVNLRCFAPVGRSGWHFRFLSFWRSVSDWRISMSKFVQYFLKDAYPG